MRAYLRNKYLVVGFTLLVAAFFLSLKAVLPEMHNISGEEILAVKNGTIIRLAKLKDLGLRYGGFWGNMTFVSTTSSNLTVRLEHANGTRLTKKVLLSSNQPETILIRGFIPIEIGFSTFEKGASLTYSYNLTYYAYSASFLGIFAAILSVIGAVLGFRGLYHQIFRVPSEERES